MTVDDLAITVYACPTCSKVESHSWPECAEKFKHRILREAIREEIEAALSKRDAALAAVERRAEAAERDAKHLRDRETTIIAALAPVCDGGQYRADIVSAIGRVVADRDDERRKREAAEALVRSIVAAVDRDSGGAQIGETVEQSAARACVMIASDANANRDYEEATTAREAAEAREGVLREALGATIDELAEAVGNLDWSYDTVDRARAALSAPPTAALRRLRAADALVPFASHRAACPCATLSSADLRVALARLPDLRECSCGLAAALREYEAARGEPR